MWRAARRAVRRAAQAQAARHTLGAVDVHGLHVDHLGVGNVPVDDSVGVRLLFAQLGLERLEPLLQRRILLLQRRVLLGHLALRHGRHRRPLSAAAHEKVVF